MPQADFYTLTEPGEAPLLDRVCRLVEQAYAQGLRVHVHAADQTQAHALDERLWAYDPASFLPHNLAGEGPNPPPPIQIGWGEAEARNRDLLLNLADDPPEALFVRYGRLIDFVPAEEERKAKARERYRIYRDRGFTLRVHTDWPDTN
jgi:DNA polymerase-3 subunit chi